MVKFNPNRVTGGTIELVRNDDGSYTSQVVGFNKIATLNLPDITTTATTSTATTDAAEKAQETLEEQTSTAFEMPSIMAREQQSDTADFGNTMTQEAAQTSKLLTETFKEPVEIKSPTNVFYDEMDQTTNQVNQPELGDPSPTLNILNEAKVKEDNATITLSKARIAGAAGRKARRDNRTTADTTRVPQGPDPLRVFSPKGQRDQRFTDDAGRVVPAYDDGEYPQLETALGITVDRQPSAIREAKEREFASGTLGISTREAKERDFASGTIEPVKQSALRTLSQTVKQNIKNIQVPSIGLTVMRAVVGPGTPVQSHAKKYFNVRGDGRIAGNASTDLYAGMNRTSAFGNLEKAGEKRISTREKTIERKGYGPGDKFYDDTQKMKDQQNDYKDSLDDVVEKGFTRTRAERRANPGRQDANTMTGGADTGGGKSIVCTAMYQTTGLKDWSKAMKIWYIYQRKYLTMQHQEGYHILFKPFVKAMHKSNIIKALGAHVAKHRTQDLKHIMFNSKPSLIGRIYRKILEPICYVVGKLWQ
tara:strand:- start:761 stop:2362 length:1602 start_codon:yes stop_codon:yes gene_type:complete